MSETLPLARFLDTLEIVRREAVHLAYSWRRLCEQPIDAGWVASLDAQPELAERLEAFVSRYGRLQDTLGEKLLPRWLAALAETPGSLIETLNRAERLGVIASAEQWLAARKLRNKLIHEYMTDPAAFAADLMLARDYSLMFFDAYNRLRLDAAKRLGLELSTLPPAIPAPRPE